MENKIAYMIASHRLYQGAPRRRLLSSMLSQIDGHDIIEVVADSTEFQDFSGCHVLGVPWNCFDLTPLVAVSLRAVDGMLDNDFSHVFLLHCTCECGPRFKELVEANSVYNVDVQAISNWGMNNIGLYSIPYLVSKSGWLWDHHNMNKIEAIRTEGMLYREAPLVAEYDPPIRKEVGLEDIYGTGTNRLIEYWANVDLIKYKANWQGEQHELITKP